MFVYVKHIFPILKMIYNLQTVKFILFTIQLYEF